MTRLAITHLPLTGLKVITCRHLDDSRGTFSRLFCSEELALAGWDKPIAQINYTVTPKIGTVRGMHFQHPPHSEMKLVTCLRGRIYDVAIDLRQGSPAFYSWHGGILSAENNRTMLIPEGFAMVSKRGLMMSSFSIATARSKPSDSREGCTTLSHYSALLGQC